MAGHQCTGSGRRRSMQSIRTGQVHTESEGQRLLHGTGGPLCGAVPLMDDELGREAACGQGARVRQGAVHMPPEGNAPRVTARSNHACCTPPAANPTHPYPTQTVPAYPQPRADCGSGAQRSTCRQSAKLPQTRGHSASMVPCTLPPTPPPSQTPHCQREACHSQAPHDRYQPSTLTV